RRICLGRRRHHRVLDRSEGGVDHDLHDPGDAVERLSAAARVAHHGLRRHHRQQSVALDAVIRLEDPAQPDIVALLGDGERHSASLYPPESNHHLPLEALREPHIRFLVARDGDGRAIGTGAIALFGIEAQCWAELKRMWVIPAARGKGVSRIILEELEARATHEGARWLRLETGIENHAALVLYERAGFTRCGPFGDYKPDPLSVFMAKELG